MAFVEPVKPWDNSTPMGPSPPSYGRASGCIGVATRAELLGRLSLALIELSVRRSAGATSESWHVCRHRESRPVSPPLGCVPPYDWVEAEVCLALLGVQVGGVCALVPAAVQAFDQRC